MGGEHHRVAAAASRRSDADEPAPWRGSPARGWARRAGAAAARRRARWRARARAAAPRRGRAGGCRRRARGRAVRAGPRVVPGATPPSRSAARHSSATRSAYSRSAAPAARAPRGGRSSGAGAAARVGARRPALGRVGAQQPGERAEQRRLARPVAAHERDDLAGGHAQGRPASAVRAVGGRRRRRTLTTGAGHAGDRAAAAGAGPSSSRAGDAAARRASRTDSGSGDHPPAAELDHRRRHGCVGHDLAGVPTTSASPPPGTRTTRSAYCTTRSRRCSASSTVTPRSCTSRCSAARTSSAAPGSSADVGSSSTSTCGCAVSTAPMATRWRCPPESVSRGGRAGRQAEQVEGLLHAAAHDVGRQAEGLHAVGELVLDRVGDEAGERVLRDDADDVGELARRVGAGVAAGDGDAARQRAAGEVRHEPVDARSRVDLPVRCGPRPAQLALGHVQVDVGQHRRRGAGVGDGDGLEADHAATSRARRRAAAGPRRGRAGREQGRAASAGSGGPRRARASSGSDGHAGASPPTRSPSIGRPTRGDQPTAAPRRTRRQPLRQRPRVGAVAGADAPPPGAAARRPRGRPRAPAGQPEQRGRRPSSSP